MLFEVPEDTYKAFHRVTATMSATTNSISSAETASNHAPNAEKNTAGRVTKKNVQSVGSRRADR